MLFNSLGEENGCARMPDAVMSDDPVEISVPTFFTAGGELENSDDASFGDGTKGCGEGEAR